MAPYAGTLKSELALYLSASSHSVKAWRHSHYDFTAILSPTEWVGKSWWRGTTLSHMFLCSLEVQSLRNWGGLYWPLMDWQKQRETPERAWLAAIDNGWMVCFVRDRGERSTLLLRRNCVCNKSPQQTKCKNRVDDMQHGMSTQNMFGS